MEEFAKKLGITYPGEQVGNKYIIPVILTYLHFFELF